ncbi:hypothetical protein G6F57_002323 [Rhizopus arrhizus]|uniref:Transcription factor CBF/NF-Y/archaeal histone domain-containing protein n=3 Tax=Rhizopus TaxID=4842 RepID=I1C1B5_RHIO9|nr:hypothetical protein RO3G_06950 [Rhizopus delemar RA 99-880]KAG0748645.1 hypothetical protein G6F23_001729 [Rhizopus arrhizus]KAG1054573.1 hypothetical protein G6F43_003422 [Rhizopus delemar]KAG0764401.1 hypothetical protein G6F24_005248 [Rhizopus arrhizus]KAG0781218.1 hypothetical protein G6F22_009680 [Rhizopus arrhizus]|eukprot:EIE82245.1 hypothetical protein RO3G_06950 [Rhizopus delemar RA 99-880]
MSQTPEEVKPERQLGTVSFPLARVKRIIKEDKDISLIGSEATFCITYATELFLEYLVKEAYTKVKQDKRKTVYYRDLAKVVKETASFEFLEDVIPTTMTLKAAVEKRKQALNEDTSVKKQKPNTNNETPVEEVVEEQETVESNNEEAMEEDVEELQKAE